MIGPFDCWTTANSGESAGADGADAAAAAVLSADDDPLSVQPVRSAPAETRAANPKLRRLTTSGDLASGFGAQVEQPLGAHVPQELADELSTTRDSLIRFSFS